MAHSRLNQNAMFDWIERCLATDAALPDDAAIMERFCFTSSEQARTLLSDLADQGRISIRWGDAGRIITLGRRPASAFTPARPLAASVVRRDGAGERIQVHAPSVLADPRRIHVAQVRNRVATSEETDSEAALRRVRDSIERGKAALATIPDPVSPAGQFEAAPLSEGEQPAAEQARADSAPPIIHGEAQQVEDRPAPLTQQGAATPGNRKRRPAGNVAKQHGGPDPDRVASPHREPAAPPAMERLPTAPGRSPPAPRRGMVATKEERRQLNLHFPPAGFAEIERRATAARQSTPAFARATLLAALDDPASEFIAFEPGHKPLISAAVVCAARAAGQPLDIFVTALITRGLAAYQADRPSVRAA